MKSVLMSIVVLCGVLLCGAVTPLRGQLPAGYVLEESAVLPDSIHELTENRFTLTVVRTASNESERRLIDLAERLHPTRAKVDSAVALHLRTDVHSGPGWREHLQGASEIPGPRWWWHDWGEVRLPYALTGAAVRHYISRLRAVSRMPDPYNSYEPEVEHTATFEYRAAVLPPDPAYPDETVVEMAASWRFRCGMRCGHGFNHSRRVIFGPDDAILRVEGDQAPGWWVS